MAHYFIAIQLPEHLQDFYGNWQKKLQSQFPYKKWMHIKDLHITLKFLGEAEEPIIDLLKEKIYQTLLLKSFIIELGAIGVFGSDDRPRVLWVDVRLSETIRKLQELVELAAAEVGFVKEKRMYRPHLTLAKKWANDSFITNEKLHTLRLQYKEAKQFYLHDIVLYKINPRQVPSYEKVAIFPLMS